VHFQYIYGSRGKDILETGKVSKRWTWPQEVQAFMILTLTFYLHLYLPLTGNSSLGHFQGMPYILLLHYWNNKNAANWLAFEQGNSLNGI
jgi:hypothetical protein